MNHYYDIADIIRKRYMEFNEPFGAQISMCAHEFIRDYYNIRYDTPLKVYCEINNNITVTDMETGIVLISEKIDPKLVLEKLKDIDIDNKISSNKLSILKQQKGDIRNSINHINNDLRFAYTTNPEYHSEILQQNLMELLDGVSKESYPGTETLTGLFWNPPNSYCGWHTNSGAPGETRIYLVWSEEDDKSFFRYQDTNTGKVITKWEKKGWQINKFKLGDGDSDGPLQWHCVGSNTNRFSIGLGDESRHQPPYHQEVKKARLSNSTAIPGGNTSRDYGDQEYEG